MFDETIFKERCSERGLTLERIARELGKDPATLYRKMKGSSDFTRAEIQNLIRLLCLTDDDVKNIFFSEKLA